MEDTEELEEELTQVAMQIILHAGDARTKAAEALEAAKQGNFDLAHELIEEADKNVLEAHRSQTGVIQAEAGGKSYPYTILFAHAQDTLMTIASELRLTKQLVDVLALIYSKEN